MLTRGATQGPAAHAHDGVLTHGCCLLLTGSSSAFVSGKFNLPPLPVLLYLLFSEFMMLAHFLSVLAR